MTTRAQLKPPSSFGETFESALTAARSRDLAGAAELFAAAIEIESDHPAAHCNRATVLAELGRWQEALAGYDRAVALKSDYAVAWSNRGNALKELRRLDEALASYDRAIAINPGLAAAFSNRGTVLKELHRLDESLASYDRALALDPLLAEAHSNRGIVLAALGRGEAALASYDRAVSIKPDHAEALSNRGIALYEMRRMDEALESYDRALALDPDLAQAHFNRSMARLALGDFAGGWLDHEWRWKMPGTDRRDFPQPLWRGEEPLAGSTILLHGEQGLGDTLQFCRYAKRVADLGARVVLEVPASLKGLLAGLDGVAQVVARGDALPRFDSHCPLMSLPLAFNTTLATIPADVPYLRARTGSALQWRERLGHGRTPRVGLVWSGGFRADQPETWAVNGRRNIPLSRFAPLAHPGIEFHSLQKGEPAESELARALASHWGGPPLSNHSAHLNDFLDTAALIENLDLVITVDTSMAHLAGAMGKPVWILNRFDACWRWLLNRDDSPWYPTARLYRQEAAGDWDGVIRKVAADLTRFCGPGALLE